MQTQHTKAEYVLTPFEVDKIINTSESFEERVLIKCLYYGGMRISEVAKLEIQHIDFDRNTINIMESKGGKTRTIPFIDIGFKADLKHLIGNRDKDKVFKQKKRMLQYKVECLGKKANVRNPDPTAKHINCHLFRHSIARRLKSEGYKPEFIQKFLGHSSIKTTMDTYGTLSLNEMQQIVYVKSQSQLGTQRGLIE